jgi:hypothetical protein
MYRVFIEYSAFSKNVAGEFRDEKSLGNVREFST